MDVVRKLQEAQHNLDLMRKEETRGIGERRFADYHSAFLSASSSVIDGVEKQGDAAIAAKFKAWKDALTSEQKDLCDFMRKDRNQVVHGSGSRRSVKVEKSPVLGSYEDPAGGGTVQVFSAPQTLGYPPPLPIIEKHEHTVNIGGVDRKVLEACSDYLDLLRKMVDHCSNATGSPR
jgi:hypothetical protein